MIVLNLKDGLGNQFFEIAFVRKLQKMYPDEKIYINDYFFQNGKRIAV
jgi:recombination DNA repair RAD52 pathway protein